MTEYHLRRSEKEITDPAEILDVIAAGKHMTLAMCRESEPYLATVNYGYDSDEEAFYFHCAGGMHRSMTVDGVIRRCLGHEPIESIEEAMQYHGAYRDEETPNGYEEPILRFVEAFDCSLLEERDEADGGREAPPGAAEEGPPEAG